MSTFDQRGACNAVGEPVCGAPCHYGGVSATRKHSNSVLGYMGSCNQTVKNAGDRCWRHQDKEKS